MVFCTDCADVVRLFPEARTCKCGKSWGRYLEDHATTVQTINSLSIGIANPDVESAIQVFVGDQEHFSPLLIIRCWINPTSEPDVQYIASPGSSMPQDERADDGVASAV